MDSGEGGVYTLSKIKEVLPCENYIMFKDHFNAPYGNKSKKKLLQIATKNISALTKKYPIKLIVFACNTMSAVVYEDLIKIFKNYIIMPIIPDIERAVEDKKSTLVLCTYTTNKYSEVCQFYRNKRLKNLYFYGFKTLAKMIDENIENLDRLKPFLKRTLKKFKKFKPKNIVLGCTHFNLIKKQLCEVFNEENLMFYENSETLAQNVKSVLIAFNLLKNGEGKTLTITS